MSQPDDNAVVGFQPFRAVKGPVFYVAAFAEKRKYRFGVTQ